MNRAGVCVCLLLTSFSPAMAQGPSSLQRLVLTETDAYAILPNEIIAAPTVEQMVYSSDSRNLLLARVQFRLTDTLFKESMNTPNFMPPGERALILWDSRTRRSREVWRTEDTTIRIQEMAWLAKSNVALVNIVETLPKDPTDASKGMWQKQTLLRIKAGTDRAQPVLLPVPATEEYRTLTMSSSRPLAVLQRAQFPTVKVRQADGTVVETHATPQYGYYLIGEDGRAGIEYTLPPHFRPMETVWAADGTPIVRGRIPEKPGGGKDLQMRFMALDARAGKAVLLDKEPPLEPQKPETPKPEVPVRSASGLRVRLSQNAIKEEGETAGMGLLWLESAFKSERPLALVSSDASEGRLLPRDNIVVFTSQGAVMAAPLLKIGKEQYIAMKQAAERAVLLSNAKQVGLSLLMFAQDNNETYPGQDGVNDKIEPYLKNASALSGFTYTFNGGTLASIDNPAGTELGFVQGNGGRAVIYADGHVKWRKD